MTHDSHASLKARIEELTNEVAEWKQAASVEAGLRRKFCDKWNETGAKLADDGRRIEELTKLIELADNLRVCQRAYMADRGNEALGKSVDGAAMMYDRVRAALQSKGAQCAPRGFVLAPLEPIDAQIMSALEWSLEWMRAHNVNGLSPFKDYPPAKETIAGMYAAMLAALPSTPSAPTGDDEMYEIGKRDGYEEAIQELDLAAGGDGEFKGSTVPGETVDVPAMKARIIDRFHVEQSYADLRTSGGIFPEAYATPSAPGGQSEVFSGAWRPIAADQAAGLKAEGAKVDWIEGAGYVVYDAQALAETREQAAKVAAVTSTSAPGGQGAAYSDLVSVAEMAKAAAEMELGIAVSPDFSPREMLDAANAALSAFASTDGGGK